MTIAFAILIVLAGTAVNLWWPRAGVQRRCRQCGCTDDRACPGGCWWVEPDLCSSCQPGDVAASTGVCGSSAECTRNLSRIDCQRKSIADLEQACETMRFELAHSEPRRWTTP